MGLHPILYEKLNAAAEEHPRAALLLLTLNSDRRPVEGSMGVEVKTVYEWLLEGGVVTHPFPKAASNSTDPNMEK